MKKYVGVGISGKTAVGSICVLSRRKTQASNCAKEEKTDCEREMKRLVAARDRALETLCEAQESAKNRMNETQAAVFFAYQVLLTDVSFQEKIRGFLNDGKRSAEEAALLAGEYFAAGFEAAPDPYLRARAEDMRAVTRCFLDSFEDEKDDGAPACEEMQKNEEGVQEPVILAAEELSLLEIMQMDHERIAGIVTQRGSAYSHLAIFARSLGIPAVAGVPVEENWHGMQALVDGAAGFVVLEPKRESIEAFYKTQASGEGAESGVQSCKARFFANITSAEEAGAAFARGAQGVGLFRTEFLCFGGDGIPGEEEQLAAYRWAAEQMRGHRVIVRTFDFGADKEIGGARGCQEKERREENPALGMRGVRWCLAHKDIFKSQLRAILRAGVYGNVAAMLPMVTSAAEVRECRRLLTECAQELKNGGVPYQVPELGVMIETPAAVLCADALAQEADFFSIGTNDLAQYLLAADRQNPALAYLFEQAKPVLLEAIHRTVAAGHQHGREVGVCGELAADGMWMQALLDAGVDYLSVSTAALPEK